MSLVLSQENDAPLLCFAVMAPISATGNIPYSAATAMFCIGNQVVSDSFRSSFGRQIYRIAYDAEAVA